MYRKIQLVGGKTYSINLPIQWIKDMGLGKQSNLIISILDDNSLLINPPPTSKKELTKVREFVIMTSDSLSRDITRAYLLGYEQIMIKTSRATGFINQELEDIELARARFPGAEIMSEGKNAITIEIIASFEKNNPYKLIHRIFNLTQSMLERIYHLIEPNPDMKNIDFREEIPRIQNIDEKINRTYFLIVRQLRGLIQDAVLRDNLKIKTLKIMDYRLISHLLENIGDNCVYICDYILEFQNLILPLLDKSYNPSMTDKKEEIFDRLIYISKQMTKYHLKIFDSFRNEDEIMAAKIIQDTEVPTEINRILEDLKAHPNKIVLSIMIYKFKDIYDLLIDICDLITKEDG